MILACNGCGNPLNVLMDENEKTHNGFSEYDLYLCCTNCKTKKRMEDGRGHPLTAAQKDEVKPYVEDGTYEGFGGKTN